MLGTLFGRLVGLRGKPRPTNLDAAMIRIVNSIRPNDSFCITENNWRHKNTLSPKDFQVSIFYSENLLVQKSGEVLNDVVTAALADYKLHV